MKPPPKSGIYVQPKKKAGNSSKTYHDDWNAPSHKKVIEEGKKYGNDVRLWPKKLADKEYETRKLVGKKKVSAAESGRTTKYKGKRKIERKRIAGK